MIRKPWLLILGLVCVFGLTAAAENPRVEMTTDLGDILIEIFLDQAPITAGNFLRYVDEERFAGAVFYRVVSMDNQPNNDIRIEVIQGGLGYGRSPGRLDPIAHETTEQTGILHKDGTISMARSNPGTASSEFFICVNDQPSLDFGGMRNPDGQGFAAFGRVIKGMDIVRAIQNKPSERQMLTEPVKIQSIRRIH
jgi:peptidyl-prolyl cis-trans isomerase A (cyclophilin A)